MIITAEKRAWAVFNHCIDSIIGATDPRSTLEIAREINDRDGWIFESNLEPHQEGWFSRSTSITFTEEELVAAVKVAEMFPL